MARPKKGEGKKVEDKVIMVDHVVTTEDLAVLNDNTIEVGDTISIPSDHPVAVSTDVESVVDEDVEEEGDGKPPVLATKSGVSGKVAPDMALIERDQFVRRIPSELNHTIEGLISKKENDKGESSRFVIPFSSIDTITCMYEKLDKKNDLQRMTKVFSLANGNDFDSQAVAFRNETRGTLVYTTK